MGVALRAPIYLFDYVDLRRKHFLIASQYLRPRSMDPLKNTDFGFFIGVQGVIARLAIPNIDSPSIAINSWTVHFTIIKGSLKEKRVN